MASADHTAVIVVTSARERCSTFELYLCSSMPMMAYVCSSIVTPFYMIVVLLSSDTCHSRCLVSHIPVIFEEYHSLL